MIREILPSDVEFARGMINSSHSDAEILASLSLRGIEPARAAELVNDLRHGRQPIGDLSFLPPSGGHRVQRQARATKNKAYWEEAASPKRSHTGKHRHAGTPWWFVLLILIFVGALVYAWLESGTQGSKDAVDESRHELPPPPGK